MALVQAKLASQAGMTLQGHRLSGTALTAASVLDACRAGEDLLDPARGNSHGSTWAKRLQHLTLAPRQALAQASTERISKCPTLACAMLSHSVVSNSDYMDCSPPGSSVHGDSPGKNTGVDCHALLQGIFPTQGLNPGLPHCRQNLHHLSYQGSPDISLRASKCYPGALSDRGGKQTFQIYLPVPHLSTCNSLSLTALRCQGGRGVLGDLADESLP